MKKTLTTQKLIYSLVMSAILSGCLPSNIGGSSGVNSNGTSYANSEHLIDKEAKLETG